MKKGLPVLLSILLCASCACAESTEETMVELPPTDTHILIACFSCTGNTWRLAEYAAQVLNADLFRIEPETSYTDSDLNYHDDNCRANREMADDTCRPALKSLVDNMAQYDTVLLASPTWWGQAPRIMETFIESHDLSGKTLLHFSTSGGSGYGNTGNILAALTDGSVRWLEGARLSSDMTADEMAAWLDEKGIVPDVTLSK